MRPALLLSLAVVTALAAAPARAEVIGGNPGPQHNYVCPHADGKPPLDCYLDAVPHLYTMCRNVKAIEIIEFGYEKSTEGVNGAKSASCLDKQKQNIGPPFKAALRQAGKKKHVVEALHKLQGMWLTAMAQLQWHKGESDEEYKARVGKPYEEFNEGIATVRTSFAANEAPTPVKAAKSHKPKRQAKAKSR
ncbi:MAG: hypothetical protein ACM3JC_08285 [Rudaea sp.]